MSNMRTGKEELYKIVRFYAQQGKKSKLIRSGVTLEEAQEHCNDPKTCKAGEWFDGYTEI